MEGLIHGALLAASLIAVSAEFAGCPSLSVSEVGFNHVTFKGDLHKVRAIQVARSGRSLKEKPLLYKFARELEGRKVLGRFSGVVPLLAKDGFRPRRWYVVCGVTAPLGGEPCETCALVRWCDCACDGPGQLFLNLTAGKIPVKDNWNSVGVMVQWGRAEDADVFPMSLSVDLTWDPYDCVPVPGEADLCQRPSIKRSHKITHRKSSETFTVEKATAAQVRLEYAISMDLSQLAAKYRLPSEYSFHEGPLEFQRRRYRQLSPAKFYLPYPSNQRSLAAIRKTCLVIRAEVDAVGRFGGGSGPQALRTNSAPSPAPSLALSLFALQRLFTVL